MKKVLTFTHVFVLLFYIVFLVNLVFFARSTYQNVNFVPFDMINSQGYSVNVWGNVLMFIPLGIYASYYSKKVNVIKVMLFVMGSSVFIEVVQYVFKRGATDIDDVILNTAGGAVGLSLYGLFVAIFRKRQRANVVVQVLASIIGLLFFVLTLIIYFFNR